MSNPPVIIIPVYMKSHNDWDITWRCVESIRSSIGFETPIILVDDGSPWLEGRELVWQSRHVEMNIDAHLSDENQGFSHAVNVGLRWASDYNYDAVLVNADMEFFSDTWLSALSEAAYTEEADVVGGLLLYPSGLIQHAGIYFSVITRFYDHIYRFAPPDLPAAQKMRVCPVTGALQYIKHDTIRRVGFYDEDFKLGWEDVDYCLRVFQAGGKCLYTPHALAIHYESTFRSAPEFTERQAESHRYLMQKHDGEDITFMSSMLTSI